MTRPNDAGSQPPTSVGFIFGVHLHQPVGNFDHVFADHVRDVYAPLVSQLERRKIAPAVLHMSGPLLEWLETHDHALLDRIGRLAVDGALELLLAGMYEPILAALPRADRVEQIQWLRSALRSRFGVAGDGLWLTERVWESDLASDLAAAGVRYVLVDDRHFLVTGKRREELHVPYRTEHDGGRVSVLAIDEKLRYLIPFRPPEEIAAYLRGLRDAGQRLAIFADDGEKFGGWPGTHKWVYERGWFDAFCDALDALQDEGVIHLCSGAEALDRVPAGGLVYLPTASYREMEAWALPATASRRLAVVERDLGDERMAGADGALVRGAHWRNFFVKYSESNRMHKKMCELSALCRASGDPTGARRAIGRAQCNDALWHGVFGGLYLPHLRAAIWRQLAIAERELRAGQALTAERVDLDGDGADEIWIHGAEYSAVVAPSRGGAMVEWIRFDSELNYADTLTRRIEAYHLPPVHLHHAAADGTPSIHEMEGAVRLDAPPPADLDDRAIGVPRLISSAVLLSEYEGARFTPIRTWARARSASHIDQDDTAITVRCDTPGLAVAWRFDRNGRIEAHYQWEAHAATDAWFAPEFSLAYPVRFEAPHASAVWRHDIQTVAKSEHGLERVRQGESVTPLFDGTRGDARVALAAERADV